MKLAPIASAALTLLAIALPQLHAQESEPAFLPETHASANALIVCGSEKFVALPGRETIDGAYAIAFTLRPKQGAAAVDWSVWNAKNPAPFLNLYDWKSKKARYALANCVIDLKRHKNLGDLPLRHPYFQLQPHGSLGVAWGPERHGHRFLLANSNDGAYTDETLLADVRPGQLRTADIKPQLDAAVKPALKNLYPASFRNYGISYSPHTTDIRAFIDRGSVDVPFHCVIAKTSQPSASGQVTLHIELQAGTPVATVTDSDMKKVEPVTASN